MEFRRISNLPPYVFAEVNQLKLDARRAGADIVDLGFGNPDIPSPPAVVEKLVEAARQEKNHRYSASRGIPNLRKAITDRYQRRFGITLDPDTEAITTIGAKEGLAHLMWTLVQPGDVALVPEPSYPIHIYAPVLAGAEVRTVQMSLGDDFFERLREEFAQTWPRPRVILTSFPHNPTTAVVELEFFERLVAFAKENDVFLVNDFAYADVHYDGYVPPSLLEVPGAKDVGVELYTMTKGHSMAGWRVGFVVGNAEAIAALAKLKSYLDYGTFQPIQIASIIALNEQDEYPAKVSAIYKKRRDVLVDGLNRAGWKVEKPAATMFVWAEVPGPYAEMGSLEFAKFLLREARVAVSPGMGFGPSGEGYVRFALVENEHRIAQAVKGIRKALTKL
ncbi:MAG: aminotransferase class I/II-fold pyridoxal phosphate-dependent enzyme [Acidimicrobiia bacterium]|nr:aminotransferase class I/II-fold pyridoxal phosphate-dependent enzyme [Acidimicrobiia bacterium]MBT8193467.1 aminotransferase class I/II-fold pyridoxal phosphate-dependent enzyme [Acidimicrobiia bacterium]NNF86902.1 aminotransferase class I/II-fold pyridoxal phosphate-dependent enzyme [Acidimicrobiia bacterium]NNL13271.1 aminotransferase class I/II-fold pyridoxal phosphate-dependent enzyme [Acidimicrobiia bacterium]NNL70005.1 aminotransferase class I/II-fold pyridoxal phosphate-dependent enz